ncbi:uncharacterized protein N7459_009564 [Penicillium hispanicum]|uniref:uncharacterized protein n=1 Tax=Penicillium hispanicum TaxID=1080232 RepID=UPI0025424741|nr:uncharacterized protein N7459_009564 [Penicillium hispanicum]KAJ5570134.1 hypothetical protein N7459_009564 [Penicillium hispanicum]
MSSPNSPDPSHALPYRLKPKSDVVSEKVEKDDPRLSSSDSGALTPSIPVASDSFESPSADSEASPLALKTHLLLETQATRKMAAQAIPKGKAPQSSKSSTSYDRRAMLRRVATETEQKISSIFSANKYKDLLVAHLLESETTPQLDSTHKFYPALKTQVKVVREDTYDAAITLQSAHDILESNDTGSVCVLNLANAFRMGGGWKNGAMAQEEELCYRSTLSIALPTRYYPMGPHACIYSPSVIIFRENHKKGYSYMWMDKPELLPVVSVISMAATQNPALDADDPSRYQHAGERTLMEEKMRLILRVAGYYDRRRLVLGALGCGVFNHPAQEVANCWKKVLLEKEFKGWFEMVLFAVLDKPDGANFTTFKATLHHLDLNMD